MAEESAGDRRRAVPRTDAVLADPRVAGAARGLHRAVVKAAVARAQEECRQGLVAPGDVVARAVEHLARPTTLREVVNATGIVVHTNLGRAPLSAAARAAVDVAAAGYTNLEIDLASGRRGRRDAGVSAALVRLLPAAEAALVVNNGAAAVLLTVAALAAGRDVVVSRGQLVEIGGGFRLPDIVRAAGANLVEVGTTNRTTAADFRDAVGDRTALLLVVHPSNFRVEGFTSSPSVDDLARLGVPLAVDIGSGLLAPDPALPGEPDAATTLAQGAGLVLFSGDKLLGGPQAGVVAGDAGLVEVLRRHPVARAVRIDKLSLAALEATLATDSTPVSEALRRTEAELAARAEAMAGALRGHGVDARCRATEATVGGGGAPGVALPSAGVDVPAAFAEPLRTADPAVLGYVHKDRLVLDLRCVPPARDADVVEAVRRAAADAGCTS